MPHAIAPEIQRQRLLVEGYFTVPMARAVVADFFSVFTEKMQLRAYGEPIIFSPGGEGKEINQGYDAFMPLIDSGIALYVWTNAKFFSTVIYTCKAFDEVRAAQVVQEFFKADNVYVQGF